MSQTKSVVFIDETEVDRRIQQAVNQVKVNKQAKIYGVSGIGNENPILARTHDAAAVELTLTTNGNLIKCVANDAEFQKFFDFPQYTDELGNVFLTITPKAFKFDRENDGEVTAISVKEYEDGDEEKGYEVHPFFKNWTSETEYSGIVSRDIAKYLSGAKNKTTNAYIETEATSLTDTVVNSQSGIDFTKSYASWANGRQIIKNTNQKYGIMSWMFIDLFRMLCLIYFGRTDIHNLFGLFEEGGFEYAETSDGERYEWVGLEQGNITGTTDAIESHTGFNKTSKHYKIFNIDHALAGITTEGCYHCKEGVFYSHLFDFDASKDIGIRSVVDSYENYSGDYGIITKMRYDKFEPAFKLATAAIPTTADFPEDKRQNVFYSAKHKKFAFDASGERGQLYSLAFYTTTLYPDSGPFYSDWNGGFSDAWGNDGAFGLRLCKAPF